MPRFCIAHDEVLLTSPPSVVWHSLSALPLYPVWWPLSVTVRVLDHSPAVVGSLIEITPRSGMRSVCRVTRLEHGEALHMEYISGPCIGGAVWRVTPEGSGTRLSFAVDLRINNRLVALLSYITSIPSLHSRLVREVFEGLRAHLARQPGPSLF